MRVLIADKLDPTLEQRLIQAGLTVTSSPGLKAADLPDAVPGHDILVVRSTKVSAEVMTRSPGLQVIVRAGAGTNTIDTTAAGAAGVFVCNTPGKNAIATAELTLGLLLSLDRRIPQAHQSLKEGRWDKSKYSAADGIYGKTLGVIGCGQIGEAVVHRARALGCEVVVWSRSMTPERAQRLGARAMGSIEELAAASDLVCVHLAHCPETRGCLSDAFFDALPDGAMVVNTSRGGIIDEEALWGALEAGRVRYATDVFDGEPGSGVKSIDHRVAAHPDVVCTPHIGASTSQAQRAVAAAVAHIIESFVSTGRALNCVNLKKESSSACTMAVRHLNRVGVLAGVLERIREAGLNVEELENILFDGAVAACANIQLSGTPSEALIEAIGQRDDVLHVRLL